MASLEERRCGAGGYYSLSTAEFSADIIYYTIYPRNNIIVIIYISALKLFEGATVCAVLPNRCNSIEPSAVSAYIPIIAFCVERERERDARAIIKQWIPGGARLYTIAIPILQRARVRRRRIPRSSNNEFGRKRTISRGISQRYKKEIFNFNRPPPLANFYNGL